MPTSEVRRRARRVDRRADDPAWMRSFLTGAPTGALAFLSVGRPMLNSNIFVYDADHHAIYLHTARRGTLREGADGTSPACFQAFSMGRIMPANRALDFSVEYESVAAIGTVEVVLDPAEAQRALGLLMAKYAPHLRPGDDYEGATEDDLVRTSVMRLRIESWSGKRNLKPERSDGYAYVWPSIPADSDGTMNASEDA